VFIVFLHCVLFSLKYSATQEDIAIASSLG